MAASTIVTGGQTTLLDNQTTYMRVGGVMQAGTESAMGRTVRTAGTAKNLFIYVSANGISANSVITLRKSGASAGLTVTYTSDQTGIKEDTSNTASYAADDEICFELALSAEPGSNNITMNTMAYQYEPDDTSVCLSMFQARETSTFSTQNANVFCSLVATGGFSGTENNTKYDIRTTCVFRDLFVNVQSNSRTTDVSFKSRDTGGAGAMIVTYASGETGIKEDTSNTDSMTENDDWNWNITTGTGTEVMVINTMAVNATTTTGEFFYAAQIPSGATIAFNTTTYMSVQSSLGTTNTTESTYTFYAQTTYTASDLQFYVSANTIATSPTVVSFRDNFGASGISVSYAAGETGLKVDTSNTSTITAGADEMDYEVATPNTSGNFGIRTAGIMLANIAEAASSVFVPRRMMVGLGV